MSVKQRPGAVVGAGIVGFRQKVNDKALRFGPPAMDFAAPGVI